MPEPIAEQILAAIATRCAAITIAGGYRQTVQAVKRRLMLVDQFKDFPVVLVLLGPEELKYEEEGLGGTAPITGVLTVNLVLYDEFTDAVEPATKILRLRADIEKALTMPDLHLGLDDNVDDIRRIGMSDVEEVVTDEWHRIEALDQYRVEYAYPLGAP